MFLFVVEIGRNRDNRIIDLIVEVLARIRTDFFKDFRGYLFRRILPASEDHRQTVLGTLGVTRNFILLMPVHYHLLHFRVAKASSHETLHRRYGVLRILLDPLHGMSAHHEICSVAVFEKFQFLHFDRDTGRGEKIPLSVFNDLGMHFLDTCNGIGGSQIDSY